MTKIVLVDGQGTLRTATKAALTEAGYRVFDTHLGVQALHEVETDMNPTDLLITELTKQKMLNGYELIKNLERIGYDGPVIVRSNQIFNPERVLAFYDPDKIHVVSKSDVPIEGLAARVRKILGR